MLRLPHEHTGVRTLDEARRDLLAIGGAPDGRDEAHVALDPDAGEPATVTGHVSALPREDGSIDVVVDGDSVFELDPSTFRGAWLTTLDGCDYYTFRLDLGWARAELSDAYNGL